MLHLSEPDLVGLWRRAADANLEATIEAALREDGASNDITTRGFGLDQEVRCGRVVARQGGVCCGLGVVEGFLARTPTVRGRPVRGLADGTKVGGGDTLFELDGPLAALLPIERSMLNLVGLAMATATTTRRFVDAVAPHRAKICDTRKTIPGLRWLQKYAVVCGGGCVHRWGLDDAFLAKDNHAAGSSPAEYAKRVREAIEKIRGTGTPMAFTAAEADTMEQVDALLALPEGTLSIMLLDGFSLAMLREAVSRRDRVKSSVLVEASGGVTLATVAGIAAAGVERISVGAITHSAGWHDVALDIVE